MKKNLKIMYLMGILAFLSFTIFISNIFDYLDFNEKNRISSSNYWDLTITPIHINDLNPSIDWSKNAADNDWCSGSGTWSDPYLIENITIDGLFSGSCIWIENSNVPFILRNCTFINNGRGASGWDSGIRFNNASNGYIENINISLNEFRGISVLDASNNNTFTHNVINNNDYVGLYLGYSSNNNTFQENTFNYNKEGGFFIYHCNFNNFSGNSITQAMSDWTREISITGKNNIFSGNIFENCGISLQPYDEPLSELTSHLIDTTNLVNGRPIYYYANKSFLTKDDFTNAGQILLVNCEYCDISRVNISNGGRGILLYYSHNNTIFNNSISNSYAREINVYKSHQNNISHNLISNIGNSIGISLDYSDKNNVSLNQIFDCNTAIDINAGFWNTISYNNLTDSFRGVDIYHGGFPDMNNTITKNIISDNDEGIHMQNSNTNGNTIFLNIFINNIINAYDNGDYNDWDNGSLGNYWDNYTGYDTNDDGVGESPYFLPGDGGNQDNFPLWDDGHNGSKIIIDDSSSNNWNWASKFTWCTGSGTWKNPYIIKDCKIDSNNSGSCIYIKNSNAFFRIENCTLYNSESQSGLYHGGIYLEDTTNGTIIKSNCSNNNGAGISLDGVINITIRECYINNNNYGITQRWSSRNISIINNTINNNVRGITASSAAQDDKIVGNVFIGNSESAIYFNPGSYSLIKRNMITGGFRGIHLWGNNNTILYNDIYSNSYGIYFSPGVDTWNNTIAHNSIYNSGSYGIHLEGANDQYNTFYNNSLTGNGNNANDDGFSNYWDNGIIGNYWDDYGGEDADDDGIGESPYLITGLANSQDNFPIWNDGHNGSKIIIDDSASNNWNWAKTRTWCSGSGTFNDPYVIKDCTIDGSNLTSGIEISNSIVYFRIKNCSIFNSSSGLDNAGIELTNVINGQLVNNNCSNNNGNGLRLSNNQNVTISGNMANNNDEYGIFLSVSHSNNLSGNTLTENYGGIYLGLSTNNTISENSANNNDFRGIYLSSSGNNNSIVNNNVTYNGDNGIFISDSHNNTIIGNNADHNYNGIWVRKSNYSIIIGNVVRNNDFIGLGLYRSNNTDVIRNTFIGNLYKNIEESESENNVFTWNYLDGNFSPFIIDNDGGGDFTWIEAKTLFFWCTGSGSYSDPYIMNNLIIDGQNSSSCIEIRDSTVFFKIEGCTLSNSGSGVYNAGITLNDVINGQVIDNDCSNNNGVGIGLYQSQNLTIDGNLVNNNEESGIFLEVSHNNILSGNTLNENSNGMYLGLSNNNTISENSANNNDFRGISLSSSSNNNSIVNNNVTYNGENGIDIYDGQDIKVMGNIADSNGWNGIIVWQCNNTIIVRNIANYNTNAGLYLWSSDNAEVIGNIFNGNLYTIYESGGVNNNFNWNVENGFTTSIIIDDSGIGDFMWVESVNRLAWIYGSGTLINPYIIELITIDGLNSTSCFTIRNSNIYFKIQNCTFNNSGNSLNDAGIKLISTTNGELINNNCSFNNANGIILDSCQNILITENSVNNNEMSGIVLIDSSNIDIINNKETINFNEVYGIHLSNSHNNNITSNTITNNPIGIFLDQSNYNYIDWNNLLDNDQAIVDTGIGNILGSNNVLPGGPIEFPFDILIIILIIGLAVVGITGAAVIVKKRISKLKTVKREISEKKTEKIKIKLEAKLDFVDFLIKERRIKLAYKNLGKVKDTADKYELMAIFNQAVKKTKYCQEVEAGISKTMTTEDFFKPVKEEIVITPVIEKEDEFNYNIFISYSTLDRDYFQIKKTVKELKKYRTINKVSYWERDSKANIVEFMEETLEVSTTFVLFCSEHSVKSKAVKDEWQAAFQMRKEGLIKLIPVYEDQKNIPKILWHLLNVKYSKEDFDGFIQNLYKEIIR